MSAQFITAEEVQQILNVSRSKSYQIIRDLNKELNLFLPISEAYETIAGLFIDRYGNIPRIGDICDLSEEGVRLVVIQMTGKRINRLKLLRTNPVSQDMIQGEDK